MDLEAPLDVLEDAAHAAEPGVGVLLVAGDELAAGCGWAYTGHTSEGLSSRKATK